MHFVFNLFPQTKMNLNIQAILFSAEMLLLPHNVVPIQGKLLYEMCDTSQGTNPHQFKYVHEMKINKM